MDKPARLVDLFPEFTGKPPRELSEGLQDGHRDGSSTPAFDNNSSAGPSNRSLAMHGDGERFLAAGFDGYVSKPVDVVELIRTVQQHCDGRA